MFSHSTVNANNLAHQTSETLVHELLDHIVCQHGVLSHPSSDCGDNLASILMKDLC